MAFQVNRNKIKCKPEFQQFEYYCHECNYSLMTDKILVKATCACGFYLLHIEWDG
jgi:hypothetical protein